MTAERTWHKSSYSSGATGSSCVEVSLTQDALVRDTKNASGAVLAFSASAWRALINSL
ncbi:protein of unknown function [Lentzea albidocapillata subsp. violacea]|uniref:DUF397 domain-containing protein n=1 Tax=Lentzea albidocapillata subsp. violacea TaxID=128104 RepID=A0A1G9J3Z2_9PSEU|nr:DUF397 domain-containing protein [Lentzea albidocapillata]SDL31976.1 protein of unknown function [Lentzea albidocapillata subsp. violacea]